MKGILKLSFFLLQKLCMPTAKVCDFTRQEICSLDTLIYYSLLIPIEIRKKIVLCESIHSLKFSLTGEFGLHPYLTRFSKSYLELVTFVEVNGAFSFWVLT